jgi:glycine oxidase
VQIPDVIIAGAGIIGVSIALELRRRGAQVLVVDRGEPGQESSAAAAGMLAPSDPETPPALRPMATASAELFPGYVDHLQQFSQMSVDFRRQGTIAFFEGVPAPAEYRKLGAEDVTRMEPALYAEGRKAYFVQEDSVDPQLLTRAALSAAGRSGVEFRGNFEVQMIRARGRDVEVATVAENIFAHTVVDCRGAWSGAPVRPRKGQSLYLQPLRAGLLEHVIKAFEVYLVPRSSGKILVGATVEDVGFNKAVEPEVVAGLHHRAAELVPALANATVTESWAGLRPGSPDDLPLVGPADTPGCFVATGHFRNGILLAPVTARIIADLIDSKAPVLDISAFSPLRFASAFANGSRKSD